MTAVRLAQRPRPAHHAPPTIVQAMNDPGLFQPWFAGPSWDAWRTVLKAAFALPLNDAERGFFRSIADREPPMQRVREAWFIGEGAKTASQASSRGTPQRCSSPILAACAEANGRSSAA
jgi:hypothetical protein